MTNVEYIYEVLKKYFSDTAIVVLMIIALLFLLKDESKKYKLYAILLGLISLLVFNDFTYEIIKKMGEAETYYRLLWVFPVTIFSAYVCIEVWDKMKTNCQKILYGFILFVFFGMNMIPSYTTWLELPDNIYQIPDEMIQASEIIVANKRKWRPKFFDDGTISDGIREYDATIMLEIETLDYLDEIIYNRVINEKGRIVQELLHSTEIDSIGIKKDRIYAKTLMENAGCRKMGETETSILYRFEWRYIEERWNELASFYNESIRSINEEHIRIGELEEPYEILYLTDMHIDLKNNTYKNVNGISAKEQICAWIEMANAYGVDAVILGMDMLDNHSEENYDFLQNQLEKLEMPYLWVDANNANMLELEKLNIYVVGEEELVMTGKKDSEKATLLIAKDDFSGKEERMQLERICEQYVEQGTKISGVLCGGTQEFEKNLLLGNILQYTGMAAYTGSATLFVMQ